MRDHLSMAFSLYLLAVLLAAGVCCVHSAEPVKRQTGVAFGSCNDSQVFATLAEVMVSEECFARLEILNALVRGVNNDISIPSNVTNDTIALLVEIYDKDTGMCEPVCNQALRDFYLRCGAPPFEQWLQAYCGQDEDGAPCYTRQPQVYRIGVEIEDNCNLDVDVDTCSTGCREAIRSMDQEVGCCLNVLNITSLTLLQFPTLTLESGIADYNLWRSCAPNVETPLVCAGSVRPESYLFAAFVVAVIAAVMNFV